MLMIVTVDTECSYRCSLPLLFVKHQRTLGWVLHRKISEVSCLCY